MKKKMKYFFGTVLLISLLCSLTVSATVTYSTDAPFNSYVYNSSDEPVTIPQVFETDMLITCDGLNSLPFDNLSDVFYDGVSRIYLCDTGNNRIVVTDTDFKTVSVIDSFEVNGHTETFLSPQGIYATADKLYVSDTENERIVVFDVLSDTLQPKAVYDKPVISALGDTYDYKPVKLTVDSTGKMYIVVAGINQGLVCLDESGNFQSFLGAPKVETNFLETFWRKIATKEQLAQMNSYVPTEYSSVSIDANGFLYVTSETSNTVPVAKINSDGDNVLKQPQSGSYGDTEYSKKENISYKPNFTDVSLYNSGRIGEDIFYIVDSKSGKIYAYNEDGYLLYAFGSIGDKKGTFYTASAIEYIDCGDGIPARLIVTDKFKGTVTILKETAFGMNIKEALRLYNAGVYDQAEQAWNVILQEASGYSLANISLTNIDMRYGNYKSAMRRMEQIREHELYSSAFGNWRDLFIRENFGIIIFSLLVSIVLIVAVCMLFKRFSLFQKIKSSETYRGYAYGSYLILHPFDGFWDLKHEQKGNLKSALTIAGLFLFLYAARYQFAGYIVSGTPTDERNVLYHLACIAIPLLLWVIVNWCVTTLMDGKGNMKDIVIATCYALKPYVIFAIPMLLLSNILSVSEVVFYTFFDTVILIWILFLLFASLISTHDYTPSKALLSVVIILVGMCLILFIAILFISIVQDVYQFGYNIFRELSYRSY